MSYNYAELRPQLFEQRNIRVLEEMRLKVAEKFLTQVSIRMDQVGFGDLWIALALLDRMVELGELVETSPPNSWGQNRTFIRPPWHNSDNSPFQEASYHAARITRLGEEIREKYLVKTPQESI